MGCWGCIWCGGMYFLTISALKGPGIRFSLVLHFLLGHQESEGRPSFSLSWCPGGELGARVCLYIECGLSNL